LALKKGFGGRRKGGVKREGKKSGGKREAGVNPPKENGKSVTL